MRVCVCVLKIQIALCDLYFYPLELGATKQTLKKDLKNELNKKAKNAHKK